MNLQLQNKYHDNSDQQVVELGSSEDGIDNVPDNLLLSLVEIEISSTKYSVCGWPFSIKKGPEMSRIYMNIFFINDILRKVEFVLKSFFQVYRVIMFLVSF